MSLRLLFKGIVDTKQTMYSETDAFDYIWSAACASESL